MERKKAKICKPTTEDRISELPDCLIHDILCLVLTVDAVRMSTLSKRWRRMWYSVPFLQIPFGVGFESQAAFILFVERCLKYRLEAMRFVDVSAVTTFRLQASTVYPKLLTGISKWFASDVIMNDVKDMDLCLWEHGSEKPYRLPSVVLNGRSLARLTLEGHIDISASCSVNLPSLKSLYLKKGIQLDDSALKNLLIGCPSLEIFMVHDIVGPIDFQISSQTLKLLEMELESDIESADIEASNLQYMRLMHVSGVDFTSCKAISILEISNVCDFEASNIEDQIPQLPLLENLTLEEVIADRLEISSKSLKYLTVSKFLDEEEGDELEVITDTPNLVSFGYDGDMKVKISTKSWRCSVEGHFSVLGTSSELINFFSNINLTWSRLDVYLSPGHEVERLDFPDNLGEMSLPRWDSLKHMKVVFCCEWSGEAHFRDFLKELAPSVETLSVEQGT